MTRVARKAEAVVVVAGVDTHRDTHTVAVIDMTGRWLADEVFRADRDGYVALLAWVRGHGRLDRVGIEGTGSYGAGLARHLHGEDVAMVEVDRPDRRARRRAGKSDPIDALAAARAALAGSATGLPKQRDGQVEALRNLRIARNSGVQARADCMRQIKSLLVTAPERVRAQLRHLGDRDLLALCSRLRPDPARAGEPEQAAKKALHVLAGRHATLTAEINDLDELIAPLVAAINPALLKIHGVGPEVAGQILVTAGDNPTRITSEPAFAMLCGVAPVPASSGLTHRHRLNRGGDRQANAAIHRIVITRLRWDPRTRAYMQRRTTEGLSKKEIIRCLKRLVARELYYVLTNTTRAEQRPQIAA
jgi:transposase